jgi:hypothetical protein
MVDEKHIKYTCKKGLVLDIKENPEYEYKDEYEEFCVYHDIQVPNGLFPECINCKIPQMALSIGENDNKGHLMKLCKIWRTE